MSITTSYRNARTAIRALAPALAVWSRLPGLYGWVAVSAGIALADLTPWRWAVALGRAPLISLAAALSGVFLVARPRALRCAALMLAGGLALLAARREQAAVFGQWRSRWAADAPVMLAGRVVTVPLVAENGGVRYTVRCDSLFTAGGLRMLEGRLVQCSDRTLPDYGRRVLLRGIYQPPSLPATEGAFDEYGYMLANGLWGTFRVDGQLQRPGPGPWAMRAAYAARQTVCATLAHLADPGHRALLQAAFLGDRVVPSAFQRSFSRAGMSHLLAISGLNLCIFVAALLTVLAPVPLPRRTKYPLVLAILWGYVLLVGPIPSLVRAAVMATLLLLAACLQRPADALNALGVAGILWLLASPQSLYTPGYQLSFAATLGIIVLLRAAQPWTRDWRDAAVPPARWVLDAGLVSTAAFAATAPTMAHYFGSVSLYGLAANLVVVSLMTCCMWLCFAAFVLQLVLPHAAWLVMHGADAFLSVVVRVADLSTVLPATRMAPFAPLPLLVYAASLTGVTVIHERLRPRFVIAAVAAVACAFGVSALAHRLTAPVEVLHVRDRYGQAAVAAFADGSAWVCQSGSALPGAFTGRLIGGWLRRQGAAVTAAFLPDSQDSRTLDSLLAASPRDGALERHSLEGSGRSVCAALRSGGRPALSRECTAATGAGPELSLIIGGRTVPLDHAFADDGLRGWEVRAVHESIDRRTGAVHGHARPYPGHVLDTGGRM